MVRFYIIVFVLAFFGACNQAIKEGGQKVEGRKNSAAMLNQALAEERARDFFTKMSKDGAPGDGIEVTMFATLRQVNLINGIIARRIVFTGSFPLVIKDAELGERLQVAPKGYILDIGEDGRGNILLTIPPGNVTHTVNSQIVDGLQNSFGVCRPDASFGLPCNFTYTTGGVALEKSGEVFYDSTGKVCGLKAI